MSEIDETTRSGDATRPGDALTRRERVVLEQLLHGLTLEQVARELFVSRNTVKTQTRSIYRKLQVGSRAELRARVDVGPSGGSGRATPGRVPTLPNIVVTLGA